MNQVQRVLWVQSHYDLAHQAFQKRNPQGERELLKLARDAGAYSYHTNDVGVIRGLYKIYLVLRIQFSKKEQKAEKVP